MELHLHKRIHESVAVSAMVALAASLNVAWIANLALTRSAAAVEALTVSQLLGPVSGLYLLFALSYVMIFWAALAWLHGRDCSHYRQGAFWLVIASLVAFFLLTLPVLYESQIVV